MIEWVDKIADEQTRLALAVGADGEGRDDATRLQRGREGYRAEMAVRRYFGRAVPWHIKRPLVTNKPKPDFSDFIDVKGRTNKSHRLGVQRKVWCADFAYLLVCGADHPRYRIVSWCWGHELATDDRWSDPGTGRPQWWVCENDPIMKPPAALLRLAVLRSRQLA